MAGELDWIGYLRKKQMIDELANEEKLSKQRFDIHSFEKYPLPRPFSKHLSEEDYKMLQHYILKLRNDAFLDGLKSGMSTEQRINDRVDDSFRIRVEVKQKKDFRKQCEVLSKRLGLTYEIDFDMHSSVTDRTVYEVRVSGREIQVVEFEQELKAKFGK